MKKRGRRRSHHIQKSSKERRRCMNSRMKKCPSWRIASLKNLATCLRYKKLVLVSKYCSANRCFSPNVSSMSFSPSAILEPSFSAGKDTPFEHRTRATSLRERHDQCSCGGLQGGFVPPPAPEGAKIEVRLTSLPHFDGFAFFCSCQSFSC